MVPWLLAVGLLAAADSMFLDPIIRVTPEYPLALWQRGVEGACRLDLEIDFTGRVEHVRAVQVTAGGEGFLDNAIDAACRWRYRPVLWTLRPPARWRDTIVDFRLGRRSRSFSPPMGLIYPPLERDCPAEPSVERPDPLTDAIDLSLGGPAPLALGAAVGRLESLLPGARTTILPDGAARVGSPSAGMELTLSHTGDQMIVRALRYVFQEGRDGFAACRYRTRAGLGSGTLCAGIPPVCGAPRDRQERATRDGHIITTLRYEKEAALAVFTCVDRRLAELLVTMASPEDLAAAR